VDKHKEETQKLVNAFVKAMKYISTHSPEEIADKMPKDYYVGDKTLYVKALAGTIPMFTTDGRMPADGPETVLKVLSTFDKTVQGKKIDLSKTYTTAFIDAAM
jgi:NitT/TauT family transport system substrate-binding protein